MIQVEALNTMVMQQKLNGAEITPNLNALLGDSWYFPNTYAQTGMGNTADAEFIMNSSLYSPKGQAAPVAYVGKALPALPRLLGQQGYDTFTMHQNTVAYWNRKELYATLGFSRYYDGDYFHWADKFDKKGSSDEVLFKKAGDLLRQVDASSTPFYAQLITLSAHSPFDLIPQARRPIKTPKDLKGSLMGDYITSENYTDFALGKFITQLKADGVWDDSIVVIYGDHTSMNENRLSGKDARAARQLLGRPYSAADRQRVPLIIHLPGQTEPKRGDGDSRASRHHAHDRRSGRARSAQHAPHGPESVREFERARADPLLPARRDVRQRHGCVHAGRGIQRRQGLQHRFRNQRGQDRARTH